MRDENSTTNDSRIETETETGEVDRETTTPSLVTTVTLSHRSTLASSFTLTRIEHRYSRTGTVPKENVGTENQTDN